MKRIDATVAGVVLIFALAYLDAAWEDTVIAATVVIGPFLTAIFASTRNTALVAAFAVFSAIVSGGYNDNYGTDDYFLRLGVTIAGSAFAVYAARAMRRLDRRPAAVRAPARRGRDRRHRQLDPAGRRPGRRPCSSLRSPTSA